MLRFVWTFGRREERKVFEYDVRVARRNGGGKVSGPRAGRRSSVHAFAGRDRTDRGRRRRVTRRRARPSTPSRRMETPIRVGSIDRRFSRRTSGTR